jgi:sigma-B regulation protein RsbU (phosphoserine phosphatase)
MSQPSEHTRLEKLLLEAARVFNSTLDYEVLIENVLRLVLTAADCEVALIFRVDHERTDMKIRYMKADVGRVATYRREIGQGVLDWVAQYREPILINDAPNDPRVEHENADRMQVEIRSLISVPLIAKGHMIGVVEAFNKNDGGFTEADLDTLVGLNNQIAVAIDNAHLYRMAQREALEKDLLYEVGKKLSGSLELDELLQVIMHSLKRVVDYDAGGVFLLNPKENEVDSRYAEGYDFAVDPHLQLKVGQGLIGHVARDGQPVIVPDVSKDARYHNSRPETHSEIVVPMMLDDRIIGVLNLESDHLDSFGKHDLLLIEAFASQAAVSVERARNHTRLLQGKKIEEQLNIAREIQQSFLPIQDPKTTDYDVAGRNVSSGQVGGDYYGFIKIVDGQTGVAIADVSGKGIPAALIMASYRASLIAEIRNNYSIRTICEKVNRLMCESIKPGNFVTAVYGVLDSVNHVLTYANCGHNLPFVLRASGEVVYLREGGPVMGVDPAGIYREQPVYLQVGDVVVWYTDGVTEVFDGNGVEFGLERLIEVVREHRDKESTEIEEAIYRTVRRYAGPTHMFDDLTMIVIKRLA